MRKIREVLRLKFDARPVVRKIAASLSIGVCADTKLTHVLTQD